MTTALEVDFSTWIGINNILQSYADGVDRADMACILACFTNDIVWEYVSGKAIQGLPAVESFFEERFTVFQNTSHHVGAPVVTYNAQDECVESVAYFMSVHRLKNGDFYSGFGRYIDRFGTANGRYAIRHRRIVAHHSKGTSRATNFIQRHKHSAPPAELPVKIAPKAI